jgi:hypothetical protein
MAMVILIFVLSIIVQLLTNYAFTNYRQTMQLIIFYLYLMLHVYATRFNVMKNLKKI